MWEKEDKLFLMVKIDRESILGKIAKANALEEELRNTLSELKNMISVQAYLTGCIATAVALAGQREGTKKAG